MSSLVYLLDRAQLTWANYLAPAAPREAWQRIGHDLDPARAERLRTVREKRFREYLSGVWSSASPCIAAPFC